ncbi:hypothetical protein JTB14_003849 [Gonioctena quinquepunctata]|nr:hypothetical protein JTB14_003849 [Gonioctena quinquepunctata]
MVFTKDQKNDIKQIICECFKDDKFLDSLSDKLSELVSTKLGEKIGELENKLDKMNERIIQLADNNQKLQMELDQVQQDKKIANLRMYGIKETKNENILEVVQQIFTDKLSLDLDDRRISSCYRIKSNQDGEGITKPIIVKFASSDDCRMVLRNKKKLKGSRVTITEDLTESRYDIFVNVREIYGKRNVWTQSGKICILIDGKKHYTKSDIELRQIKSPSL